MSGHKSQTIRWFGLTGGIASGKSTVAQMFVEAGVPVVDADLLARQVVLPGSLGLSQVVQAFGTKVLSQSGELDRKKLGQVVFGNPQALLQLESLLHPLIQLRVLEMRSQFQQQGHSLAIYDVPLLFEKKSQAQFEAVILVWCDLETQRIRMKSRDALSDLEIENRLRSQISLDEKRKLSDFVLENNADLDSLREQFRNLLPKLQSFEKA